MKTKNKYPFPDEVTFNLECDPEESFFALYASLRIFMESEAKFSREHNKSVPVAEHVFSMPGAIAYSMLQDLHEAHEVAYNVAEARYNGYKPGEI